MKVNMKAMVSQTVKMGKYGISIYYVKGSVSLEYFGMIYSNLSYFLEKYDKSGAENKSMINFELNSKSMINFELNQKV